MKELRDIVTEKYLVITEAEYAQVMDEIVVPKLDELRREFYLKRSDGHMIHGEYFQEMRDKTLGSVLISHGFTESCDKYREMIYYFLKEGYDVCVIDHRNHGKSRRDSEGKVSEQATHVDHFQDYVDDLHVVVAKILMKELPGPYYIFAHSMGGAIASAYLEQHPTIFKKAVLSSPMLEINRGNLPYWLAKTVAGFLCMIGKGKSLLPGQGQFSDQENFENSAATSLARYRYYYEHQKKHTHLQNSGCSCRWSYEAMKADERILKKAACAQVKIPVRLFQAENDTFVLPGGQEKFIASIPDGELIFVPEAKHEIYFAEDEIFGKYVQAVLDFLSA